MRYGYVYAIQPLAWSLQFYQPNLFPLQVQAKYAQMGN